MSDGNLISRAEAVRRYTWDGMQSASGAALPASTDTAKYVNRISAEVLS